MRMHKHLATLLVTAGLVGSSAAMAADNGFYLGGSVGQARPSFDSSPGFAPGIPITHDASSYAWKATGGYQINKNIGVELVYLSLGTYNVAGQVTPTTTLFTDVKITGWGAALVGAIPLNNQVSVLGRIGENRIRESRGPCSAVCGGLVTTSADNSWSTSFGLGLKYDFNENVSARGEVERFTKIGSNGNTLSGHANLFTVGLGYKF